MSGNPYQSPSEPNEDRLPRNGPPLLSNSDWVYLMAFIVVIAVVLSALMKAGALHVPG